MESKRNMGLKGSSMSKKYFLLIILFCVTQIIRADIYDNRFIPLFAPQQFFVEGLPSSYEFNFIAITGSEAFATDEKTIGIPEIFGTFDLNTLATSIFQMTGKSPLRSDLLGRELPFEVNGRIQGQGFFTRYYQSLGDHFAFIAELIFLKTNSRQTFMLDEQKVKHLKTGDIEEIMQSRRLAFEEIGIIYNDAPQHGISDIDLSVRGGSKWEYTLKCRRIWAGLTLGGYIPTGVKTSLCNAASIPFGGNGFGGIYVKGDALFELKEDIKTGFLLQIIKRFARTTIARMPMVASEPYIFGPIIGPAHINPGPTLAFSPYFILENLRGGLGAGVHYTLVSHWKDSWCDRRENPQFPTDLSQVERTSKWGADYFTINVFYDFGKQKTRHPIDPIISFRWDVPSMLFVSHNNAKTNKVSLGVEIAY
jgi:hypothetical protein